MNIFDSIDGMVEVELTCADMSRSLNLITSSGIELANIQFQSALTVRVEIKRNALRKLRKICAKQSDVVRVKRRIGIYWDVKSLLRRPVLVIGIVLLCVVAYGLSNRILFIDVKGNATVQSGEILDQAKSYGVYFGVSADSIRSERVKNGLLEAIPQLQWVGVNTAGCVATIHVKENVIETQPSTVSSTFDICASQDAFVTYVYATKGAVSCKVGQTVEAGQILISAHIPAGDTLLYTGAAGEVYGDTSRKIQCVSPISIEKRGEIIRSETKISLIIGKNRINLHNDSGIYSSSCVKIIEEHPLSLPGGFDLPVIVLKEHITYYETQEFILDETAFSWLENYCGSYINRQMIAGKILSSNFKNEMADDLYFLQGSFSCNEMIGRITNEEIFHGEDR